MRSVLYKRQQKLDDAPGVSVRRFVAGIARRAEAACRTDWTALPIVRSVLYKHTAENTMNVMASFVGERGLTASTKATHFIQTAQNLYRHLHHGFDGQALHRVPIAGDTSNLPFVEGLTQLERRLAWSQHFLARQLPGSQELRQLMER